MATSPEFISKAAEKEIVKAIQTAEKNTSGEIRVHIEDRCDEELISRVKSTFYRLEMDKTKLRNGVLFYLAANNRQFYILGDQGIHEKVPEDFWEDTIALMKSYFVKKQFAEGLIQGILRAGEQLKKHFPHQKDDQNELPDEISRG